MRSLLLTMLIAFGAAGPAHCLTAKEQKLLYRGSRVARSLCDGRKLATLDRHTDAATLKRRLEEEVCHDLGPRRLEALMFFLENDGPDRTSPDEEEAVSPPRSAKCPVCGMYPYKFPRWAVNIRMKNGKEFYFDGAKDMFKYYLLDKKYLYDRKNVSRITVQDFYTLRPVDAEKAFFVTGSDIRGPMGDELIPFSSLPDAETFLKDHHGRSILRFFQVSPETLRERRGSLSQNGSGGAYRSGR